MSESIVILGAARTPMGSFQGDFASLAAHDLGAEAQVGGGRRQPGKPYADILEAVGEERAIRQRPVGEVVGIDRFGESAPAGELFKQFGITAEAVVGAVKQVIV